MKNRSIGTAEFKNFQDFLNWLKSDEGKNWERNQWSNETNRYCANDWDDGHIGLYKYQKMIPDLHKALDIYDPSWRESHISRFIDTAEYLDQYGQLFQVLYTDPRFTVIFNAEYSYAIPTEFLDIHLFKDYGDIPYNELHLLSGTTMPGLIPKSGAQVTANSIQDRIHKKEDQIREKEEELKRIEEEKAAELQKLKAELEERYRQKTELLMKKQEELKAAKEKLEHELFIMDTEIYAIRCYYGETVSFTHLQEGRAAPKETPVVAYQKIRFLDEELAKWLSLYDFDGEGIRTFEDVLSSRTDLQDILCPGPKSITLARNSRDKVQYGINPEIANALKAYEVFHGGQIAVLLRDGDNIWIGWTDVDRINLSSENVFYQEKTDVQAEAEAPSVHTSSKEDVASRYFIFYLLQGIFDNGKLLKAPEGASMSKPGGAVIFSYADGWIEDNRFGAFSEIVERTNAQPMNTGDMILTTLRITRDDYYEHNPMTGRSTRNLSWNNDRGRGEKNRTHDAEIPDKAIVPINLVDVTAFYNVHMKEFKCNVKEIPLNDEGEYGLQMSRTDKLIQEYDERWTVYKEDYKKYRLAGCPDGDKRLLDVWKLDTGYDPDYNYYDASTGEGTYEIPVSVRLNYIDRSYYISAVKQESRWRDRESRANLQIEEGEYLNLTYLNSVWVQYAIQNRKVGGWKIANATMNYAQSLPYLKIALDYLREREEKEAEMLNRCMDLYPDWQVDLSEWKMKNQYHRLTETRAKAFAKEYPKPF